MMDVMLVVSTPDAAPLLVPLAAALTRQGARWGCFVTGDGARLLTRPEVVAALRPAVRAVACEHSWQRQSDEPCPIAAGSQLDHSDMLGAAHRVLAL